MSLPNCKSRAGFSYDTGTEFLEVDIKPLITPEPGETFNYFLYSGAANPKDGICFAEGTELGIMRFSADNGDAPDGTIAKCTYKTCYEEDCAPECCCEANILIEVTD